MAHAQTLDKTRILETFPLRQALPAEVSGWMRGREDHAFTRDDIFDYLDGGGEIYLAYDFQFVFVREYVRADAPSIIVEIYQMSSSPDAYGLFTHDTDGEEIELGQGAIYGAGLLRFWKDTIFARIMADRETPEAKAVIMEVGTRIVAAIPGNGEEPGLIKLLPAEGLRPKSLRYFHAVISLNAHLYLANANILNLSPETGVALAQYEREGAKARVILVEYLSAERAADAERRFTEMFLLERYEAGRRVPPKKLEDGNFSGLLRKEKYLLIVIEAEKKSVLDWIAKTISRNLEGKEL
jgi:hypothetical protein